jgi:hypothetical protein
MSLATRASVESRWARIFEHCRLAFRSSVELPEGQCSGILRDLVLSVVLSLPSLIIHWFLD